MNFNPCNSRPTSHPGGRVIRGQKTEAQSSNIVVSAKDADAIFKHREKTGFCSVHTRVFHLNTLYFVLNNKPLRTNKATSTINHIYPWMQKK
jgi:hypothetical protein